MILCDVALALLLYLLLNWSTIHFLCLLRFSDWHKQQRCNQFAEFIFVLSLLSDASHLNVFGEDQLHALVLLFLDVHSTGYSIGLVFFGISILILGYLFYKSGYFPKIFAVLLIIASLGYLTNSFANFLLPNYDVYEAIFALVVFVPAFIAELSLCFWLLVKGVKIVEKGKQE